MVQSGPIDLSGTYHIFKISFHVTVENKLECLSFFPHEGEARAAVILGGNVDGVDFVLCDVIAISLGDVCVTVHPVLVKKNLSLARIAR